MNKYILNYRIEGKAFTTTEQYITGRELKIQGGIPLDSELYLAIEKPFQDELITNDTQVNLARPEIEQFFVKKSLKFFIDGVEYTSYKQWISGEELRIKGNVPENYDLYLKVEDGWLDNKIELNEFIDLAMPGKEEFYTKVHQGQPQMVQIHIDNNPHTISVGSHLVSELKMIGNVPGAKDLDQVINGILTELSGSGSVLITGGEIFFSRIPDGVSS